MKWILAISVVLILGLAPAAQAHEARLGVGVNYSAQASHLQVDLDPLSWLGFQAALGEAEAFQEVSAEAGARVYLLRAGLFSAYTGGMAVFRYGDTASWTLTSSGGQTDVTPGQPAHARFIGPTAGVLVRSNRGIGGYVQVEQLWPLAGPMEAGGKGETTLGAGVQWWF